MPELDPRTLAFYTGAIGGLLAVLTFAYWRTQRTYAGFGWWILSLVMFAAAPGSVALRGIAPESMVGYGPSVFGMASMLAVLAGQNSFFQVTGATAWATAAALLSIVAMIVGEMLGFPDVRQIIGAATVATLALIAAVRFGALAPPGHGSASVFCAAVVGLFGLTRLWRAWYFLTTAPGYDVLVGSTASIFNYSANAVFVTLWTFAFVVLNASRLERELEDSRAELRLLSRVDPLTGLRNRRAFFSEAETALRQARRYQQPMSLLVLDVDHFKQVNDRFGHPAGDGLLMAAADTIAREVRSTDLTGRMGGEEFALLLVQSSATEAATTAERVRRAVEVLSIESRGHQIAATASIGTATTPDGSASLEDLVHHADAALYKAKHSGRNRVVQGAVDLVSCSSIPRVTGEEPARPC